MNDDIRAAVRSIAGPTDWSSRAYETIRRLTKGRTFSSDDVWQLMEPYAKLAPKDPRALGKVMLKAKRAGLIELVSGEQVISKREICHSRPIQVWKKL